MLKGFNVPLTPKGLSTLNPAPPWHYSCDFLTVEFWADPKAVAAYLPEGLDADEAGEGHAGAFFLDWQFTGENEEYLDPARYQYREFFILLDALYKGQPVTYCPYMFVDNDAALARGWAQGYPKRIGSIFQTRLHAASGKAGPQLAEGSKFAASMSAGGKRMAECLVTLRVPVADTSAFSQRPVVNQIHVPQLAAEKQDTPALHKLVMTIPHHLKVEQLWSGEAILTFPPSRGEELSDLEPVRTGFGARASMSFIVDDLKDLELH
jgi:acetoacetate decarboxylase